MSEGWGLLVSRLPHVGTLQNRKVHLCFYCANLFWDSLWTQLNGVLLGLFSDLPGPGWSLRTKDLSNSFSDMKEGPLPMCSKRCSFRVWESPERCLSYWKLFLMSLHVPVYQVCYISCERVPSHVRDLKRSLSVSPGICVNVRTPKTSGRPSAPWVGQTGFIPCAYCWTQGTVQPKVDCGTWVRITLWGKHQIPDRGGCSQSQRLEMCDFGAQWSLSDVKVGT